MQRHTFAPRADWRERAARLGFAYAEIAGEPYWDETAGYEFSADDIDAVEAATAEIERLCRAACAHAVATDRHEMLGIPPEVWPIVVRSWNAGEPSLYGRLDLRWDGTGPPKLLEYNADTPTSLYEASVIQWEWLTCAVPDADQFNSLHEALIAAWPGMRLPHRVHFACMRDTTEDRGTVDYLRDTAIQAGLDAPFIAIEDIGWNGRTFTDLAEHPIEAAFKLYPWEWLLNDTFGLHLAQARTRWVEPAWRLLLSSKGILALLWEMFPGHPNLLPAFRDPGLTGGAEIRKPLFGREGANVTAPGIATEGPYGAEGFVHQQYAELPCFAGRYPVLGSWLIAGEPHGMGIREDASPITCDASRFVPHYFRPPGSDASGDAP
jgi:glutathionylspermidine synthase